MAAKPKWKKLLYLKQPYPDNHVDSSFLELMRRNTNVSVKLYSKTVMEASRVTQQLSVAFLFLRFFLYLKFSVSGLGMSDWKVMTMTGMINDQWESITSNASLELIFTSTTNVLALFLIGFTSTVCTIAISTQWTSIRTNLNSTTLSNAAVFSMVLIGLTPILKNLTRDVSDDSLFAFTAFLLCWNLLLCDYGEGGGARVG